MNPARSTVVVTPHVEGFARAACVLFLLLGGFATTIAAATLQSGVLDDGRSIDWTNSGVPGGIPHRSMIFATLDAATYGNGTTDASLAIQNALNACPEHQVVYLPAGNYRLNSTVSFEFKRNVTLRGAGPGKTTLRPSDNLGTAITCGQTGMSAERRVISGSSKGSRTITVDNATGIQPGTMIDLYQANDPDFYWSRGGTTDRTGQYAMVTAVSGTTLQLEDPLVWDFARNPRFRYAPMQGMAGCGVEDLTITAGSSYDGSMIQYWQAYAAWVRNVETAWGNGNEHIMFFGCLRSEIRDSYIHDTHSTTDGYGIVTLKSSSIIYGRGGTTGLRIENNIFSGLWYAMILETEVGSVVAYNYSRNARYTGWPDYQIPEYNSNHGEHGMMVLFEGNIGAGYQNDGYHGSTSHQTLFRNWFSGQHVDANRTGNIKTIDLCRFSYHHNVIGNILGNPGWPRTTIGRYEMTGMPGYVEQAVIYRLGYPNMGNNGYSTSNPPSNPDDGGLDPKVKSTLLRWGNFDYHNNAARWLVAEIPSGATVPATQALPPSFYLRAKPAWWGATPWPAFGPDVAGLVNKIPAQLRYENGSTTPPPLADTAAPTVPAGLTATAVSSSRIDLAWTASSDNVAVSGYRILRGGTQVANTAGTTYTNSGLTPATAYSYTVAAYDAAGNASAASASASTTTLTVTTTNQAPTVSAATASPSPVTGTTANLSATATDDGGEPALTYLWSATGPAAVTFSPNGSNAAKASTATFSKAGSYTITVTAKDVGNLTSAKSVTVTVQATPTALAISPTGASVQPGMGVDFNALVSDQFRVALATQPALTWTVSGGGTIATSGLFTAGPGTPSPTGGVAATTYVVTAQAGSVSGTGLVTVSTASTDLAESGGGKRCGGGSALALIAGLGLMVARRRRG